MRLHNVTFMHIDGTEPVSATFYPAVDGGRPAFTSLEIGGPNGRVEFFADNAADLLTIAGHMLEQLARCHKEQVIDALAPKPAPAVVAVES